MPAGVRPGQTFLVRCAPSLALAGPVSQPPAAIQNYALWLVPTEASLVAATAQSQKLRGMVDVCSRAGWRTCLGSHSNSRTLSHSGRGFCRCCGRLGSGAASSISL